MSYYSFNKLAEIINEMTPEERSKKVSVYEHAHTDLYPRSEICPSCMSYFKKARKLDPKTGKRRMMYTNECTNENCGYGIIEKYETA